MFALFYDMQCNVWSVSYGKTRWSDRRVQTAKHTAIPCFFDKRNVSNWNPWIVREQDEDRYDVYLPIQYKDIVKWDDIELIDWTSMWIFVADIVTVYDTTGNTDVDNVLLTVSPR